MLLGGHDDTGVLDSVEVFNPATNQVPTCDQRTTYLYLHKYTFEGV